MNNAFVPETPEEACLMLCDGPQVVHETPCKSTAESQHPSSPLAELETFTDCRDCPECQFMALVEDLPFSDVSSTCPTTLPKQISLHIYVQLLF